MKLAARSFAVFAATLVAFIAPLRAQLVTYQTVQPEAGPPAVSGYSGSVSSFNGGSRASQGEIFTNVLAIDSMTYNLFTTGSPVASTLQATFGEWNTTSNSFAGTTLNLGQKAVQSIGGWSQITIATDTISTFTLSFDISAANGGLYLADPAKSYALLLTQVTAGQLNYGIGRTDGETDFAYGTGAYVGSTNVYSTPGQDYTFAQIVVVPNDGNHTVPITPVPEASTVASAAALAMVGALVGFRVRQRRQLTTTAVAA
jgi:hypothetical protein